MRNRYAINRACQNSTVMVRSALDVRITVELKLGESAMIRSSVMGLLVMIGMVVFRLGEWRPSACETEQFHSELCDDADEPVDLVP